MEPINAADVTGVAVFGPTNPRAADDGDGVLRVAHAVALVPEREAEYRRLHADAFPAVLATLRRAGVRAYQIFLGKLDGQTMLFSYLELAHTDLARAQDVISACAETRRWWQLTDVCQRRLPGTPAGEQWLPLERVFSLVPDGMPSSAAGEAASEDAQCRD